MKMLADVTCRWWHRGILFSYS